MLINVKWKIYSVWLSHHSALSKETISKYITRNMINTIKLLFADDVKLFSRVIFFFFLLKTAAALLRTDLLRIIHYVITDLLIMFTYYNKSCVFFFFCVCYSRALCPLTN